MWTWIAVACVDSFLSQTTPHCHKAWSLLRLGVRFHKSIHTIEPSQIVPTFSPGHLTAGFALQGMWLLYRGISTDNSLVKYWADSENRI